LVEEEADPVDVEDEDRWKAAMRSLMDMEEVLAGGGGEEGCICENMDARLATEFSEAVEGAGAGAGVGAGVAAGAAGTGREALVAGLGMGMLFTGSGTTGAGLAAGGGALEAVSAIFCQY
jgi:hypothetical protein